MPEIAEHVWEHKRRMARFDTLPDVPHLAWLPLQEYTFFRHGRRVRQICGLIAHVLDSDGRPLCGQRLDGRYQYGTTVPDRGRPCKLCDGVLRKQERVKRCQKCLSGNI